MGRPGGEVRGFLGEEGEEKMQETITKCDICGEVKRETNDWFRLVVETYESKPDIEKVTGNYMVVQFNESGSYATFLAGRELDVCGEECLTKAESRVRGKEFPCQNL